MKIRAGQLLLLLAVGAILLGVGGCSTNEPENASVRPWDSPQGWENGMPIQNQQHE
jgi:neutral trehalase